MSVETPPSQPDSDIPPVLDEPLSAKETRSMVTPYAFGVADELLGQPLASPWRRLFAQAIDGTIVVLLSSAHALVLAFFVAITFFRAGKHLAEGEKKRGFARKSLRFTGAFLLFFITYGVVESVNSPPDIRELDRNSEWLSSGLILAQKYAWDACEEQVSCYKEVAAGFGEAYGSTDASQAEVTQRFDKFLKRKALTPELNDELKAMFINSFEVSKATGVEPSPDKLREQALDTLEELEIAERSATDEDPALKIGLGKDNDTKKSNSLISWIDGLIKDLGLGFGWAALYYSVLTAWWRGHTIGKRLLRIKVVKLDGSPLNLWESFGRYGGYTAGIATGLLGFLQIFWDPNRQTIQDKIAETLVLYRPAGSIPIPELINANDESSQEPVAK